MKHHNKKIYITTKTNIKKAVKIIYKTRNNRYISILLILILLTGCSITSNTTLELQRDYSKIEVISLQGEGECEGTADNPCKAIANFKVTETLTINPMRLIEFDMPIKQIKGYNKKITFEPGHDYSLKYEVLKLNPKDTIKWTFAGVE